MVTVTQRLGYNTGGWNQGGWNQDAIEIVPDGSVATFSVGTITYNLTTDVSLSGNTIVCTAGTATFEYGVEVTGLTINMAQGNFSVYTEIANPTAIWDPIADGSGSWTPIAEPSASWTAITEADDDWTEIPNASQEWVH